MTENKTRGLFFYYAAIQGVAFFLPTSIKLSSISISLLVISWIFASSVKSKIANLIKNKDVVLIYGLYFVVMVAGILITENWKMGMSQLERNSSLVILTIVLASGPSVDPNVKNRTLLSYVASCVAVLIIDLVVSTYQYVVTGDFNSFFYYALSDDYSPFHHNPIYLSIYFVFGIMICVYFLKNGLSSTKLQACLIFTIVFLLLGTILLSSKTVFAILMIYFLSILFIALRAQRSKSLYALISVGAAVLIILLFTFGSTLKERYREIASIDNFKMLNEQSMQDFSKINGLSLRLMFWKFGITESVKDSWFFGQGTGDVQDYLNKTYERHNMAITLSDKEKYGYYNYNAHNQYIETFLKNGIIGIATLLLIYVYFLRQAIRFKSEVFIGISMLILIISLTESFQETNKGIVFSVFFMNFLFLFYRDNHESV